MSVLRQLNLLGQQRLDIPHIRALESSIAADFDLLAGRMVAGLTALVLTGFDVVGTTGVAASALQVNVAGATMLHPLASENGSIFFAPVDRPVETLNVGNARVSGGFTSAAVNYLGVDLRRSADASTADLVQFLNPDTNLETPKEVALGRTLDYVFVITTQDFSTLPGVAPLAKITVDANNNVTAIQDARSFLLRLGAGGTVPDAQHAYAWPAGRTEVGDDSEFGAGDKALHSLKDWLDAAMTRLWELGGGQRWYSPTADRNVQMGRSGAVFTNGEYFEWSGTNLHWKGLTFLFDNSTASFNDVANQTGDSPGLTNLADGECVYVDVDRTANRTGGTALVAAKAVLATLGTPAVPGSRFVIAWRHGSVIFTRDQYFAVGSAFAPATDLALGVVKLSIASDTPAAPVVAVVDAAFTAGARGVSRTTLGGNLGAGTLQIGGGAQDTLVQIQASHGVTAAAQTATFPGLTATGNTTGTGVAATGGSSGAALTTQGTGASNRSPQYYTQDASGNVRHLIDHNGFPMGRRSEFREEWMVVDTTLGAQAALSGAFGGRWSLNVGSANTLGYNWTIDATLGARSSSINSTNAASNWAKLSTAGELLSLTDNTVVVIEWESFQTAAGAAATSHVDLYTGFCDNAPTVKTSSASHFAWFRKPQASTNWFVEVGTGTSLDTTVAVASNAYQRMRIELHGVTTEVGAANGGKRVALFFINETLVATAVNGNAFGGGTADVHLSNYYFAFATENDGTGPASAIPTQTGPVLASWNRMVGLVSTMPKL